MSTLAQEPQKLTEHVTAFVEADMRERLERTARENERSMSAEVRLALRAHLDNDFARPVEPGRGVARGRAVSASGGSAAARPNREEIT